jgi:Ca2+-binding EF-hand superfamily protein
MEITMWEKIKKWFGLLDLNKDGKVTAEDLEVARAIADKNAKAANEAINEVAEAAVAVKKVVKGRKKK